MKKIIFLCMLSFLIIGCTNIKTTSIEDIINKKTTDNYDNKIYNVYHSGYKYYLPKTLNVETINENNEIISSDKYTFYMYVDLVSVYKETKISYEKEENLTEFLEINYKDLSGYLKIKEINENYLVEIMYNYAKIEVIVENKETLNIAINDAFTILTTIKYNKDIIKNLMDENVLNYKDETLNLFDTVSEKDNFIKYEEEYDDYEEDIPDYDQIN